MKRFLVIFLVLFTISLSAGFEKVDLNKADEYTLARIPGVGRLTARRIVEYRQKNGNFKNIEDLKNIPGVAIKRYEALKDRVYINKEEK